MVNVFKDDFKYYKSKCPPPSFVDVLDFNTRDSLNDKVTAKCVPDVSLKSNSISNIALGLKPFSDWKLYELNNSPGLLFIPNPFVALGQRYWVTKCLDDYTCQPQKLNVKSQDRVNNWWDTNITSKSFIKKIRWATLGYHHNWDTKVYSDDNRSQFPTEVDDLTRRIASFAGFNDFKSEAAIINYYDMGSTLSGHTDYSEINREAPLFSISFGQSAIFLIGGLTVEEKPKAIYLHSGDIVVMSNASRLHYHGVPRILPAPTKPWTESLVKIETFDRKCCDSYDSSLCEVNKDSCKKLKTSHDTENKDSNLNGRFQNCMSEQYWEPFERYLNTSRINMNIRQVLYPGQEKLEQKITM